MGKLEIVALCPNDVHHFKNGLCRENSIIARLLREEFAGLLAEPIWDVGSGEGDVSIAAFPNSRVLHLEPLIYPTQPLPAGHLRQESDFFDYTPVAEWLPGTLLFCHSLQFLDGNPTRLVNQVERLAPKHILVVVNRLEGDFEIALNWIVQRSVANPEVPVEKFPPQRWKELKRQSFTAIIDGGDYDALARGLLFIHDVPRSPALQSEYADFLAGLYRTPVIHFRQDLILYEKQTQAVS